MAVIGTSTGKVILSGEHSVVYGQPALVTSVDLPLRVTVKKQNVTQSRDGYTEHILNIFSQLNTIELPALFITTESKIKTKSGMGSSAAYAHALLQSLYALFEMQVAKDQLFEQVLKAETFVHSKPSGVDPAAVVYGGTQLFRRAADGIQRRSLSVKNPVELLFVHSGTAVESTGEMVQLVAKKHQDQDLTAVFQEIGTLTKTLTHQFESGEVDGSLITQNHHLLQEIGVVGERAQNMVTKIENWGGYAKITGAGGVQDGSGWILVYAPNKQTEENILASGWETFTSTVQ